MLIAESADLRMKKEREKKKKEGHNKKLRLDAKKSYKT